jgi:hypothetical protein
MSQSFLKVGFLSCIHDIVIEDVTFYLIFFLGGGGRGGSVNLYIL